MSVEITILFLALLFVAAFFYASVGHGGASGYLALMALFSFAPETMRPTALVLNIFVSGIAFYQFYRKGYFQWKLFWPFAIASIPAAFIGGLITVDEQIYKRILGILLFFAIARFMGFGTNEDKSPKKQLLLLSLSIGAVIGLFSGMIGIGGGIILSPLILLLGWANLKQTAAISALFIFVNSVSGLAGLVSQGVQFNALMWTMLGVAFVGGLLGSYFGANKFNSNKLKYALSFVLLIASVKLIFA
ncbi:MAG: sulfite exporter TauE/SafE family protein [Flavobacteriaceae bacterium]